MSSFNQTLNKARGISLSQILTICLLTGVFALPMAANAQSSACAANESLQTFSFANPNTWPQGSAGPLNFTLGAGANVVTCSGEVNGAV